MCDGPLLGRNRPSGQFFGMALIVWPAAHEANEGWVWISYQGIALEEGPRPPQVRMDCFWSEMEFGPCHCLGCQLRGLSVRFDFYS